MGGSEALSFARECGLSEGEVRDLIAARVGAGRVPRTIRFVTDTSDFFRVDYDDVLLVGGRPYLIRNNEREGRFGLDDEPKFWVKRAVDLLTGEMKIVKLGFQERYQTSVGGLVFDCVRSPDKEARILDLVRGHASFMQGFSAADDAGNTVRVIDFIRGRTLGARIESLAVGHEEYFYGPFRTYLELFVELAEAVRFLHRHGEKHGDIRRDHVLMDERAGAARWIDFDFNYSHAANPFLYDIFGLGNILVLIAGKGDLIYRDLQAEMPAAARSLEDADRNIIFRNRVVNVGKVFPYVPGEINRVLLHFSAGAPDFYESVDELIDDVRDAREHLGGAW